MSTQKNHSVLLPMSRRLLGLWALLVVFDAQVDCVKKVKPSSLFQTFAAPPMSPYPYVYYPQYSVPQYYPLQGYEQMYPPQPYPPPPMYMQPQQMYMPYPPPPPPPSAAQVSQQQMVMAPQPRSPAIAVKKGDQHVLFADDSRIPKSFFAPIENLQAQVPPQETKTTPNPMHAALENAVDEANREIEKANRQASEFAAFDKMKFSPEAGSLSDSSVPIDNHILNWRELVGLPTNPLLADQSPKQGAFDDVMKPLLPS